MTLLEEATSICYNNGLSREEVVSIVNEYLDLFY